MTDIVAAVITDSIGDHSPRLHTQRWRHPKFNHQEALRHRKVYVHDNLALTYEPDFSFSVSSSRAIPFLKGLQEARDPTRRAAPVYWGEAQKGMSPGQELNDTDRCIWWPMVVHKLGLQDHIQGRTDAEQRISKRECAKRLWDLNVHWSTRIAEAMVHYTDIHKSVPNRMIETYVHVNCLATATEPGWMNFFGLRLDGAADPTLRALAEQAWIGWNESKPKLLKPGEWHLPFADDERSREEAFVALNSEPLIYELGNTAEDLLNILKKMSVARCAHLSYESFETGERMPVARCLELYDRFATSIPMHASPLEHQATPDIRTINPLSMGWDGPDPWANPHLAGNLGPGWVQLRKTIPGEAVAPLPEAYR